MAATRYRYVSGTVFALVAIVHAVDKEVLAGREAT
jgi:hypothetical protein